MSLFNLKMKITVFQIKFDNPQGVFIAGDLVSGHVQLTLAKPLKMRSIKIYFSGNGKSYWDVRKGKHTTKYRARETYLNHFITLFGSGTDGSSIEHPAGSHAYPFAFQLQEGVPSSFEGSRGYVRYFCKATIDRPWKFDSHDLRAFTVIHHFDLNRFPNALTPISAQQAQEIEGCCCNDGSVVVKMDVNKSGYVPGEPLVYDIAIDNKSSNTIEHVHFEMEQVVNYTGYSDSLWSSGHPKYHEKKQSFNLFAGRTNIKGNSSVNINKATYVPSVPPTQLEGCNIIDIRYFVKLKVPCGWTTVKMIREITIGTIPLRESWPQPLTQPQAPTAPVGLEGLTVDLPPEGPLPAAFPTAPPSYDEISAPPPAYAECAFGRQDIRDEHHDEHTSGDTNWAPAYPYYDWSQHSTLTFGGEAPSVARPNPPSYDEI